MVVGRRCCAEACRHHALGHCCLASVKGLISRWIRGVGWPPQTQQMSLRLALTLWTGSCICLAGTGACSVVNAKKIRTRGPPPSPPHNRLWGLNGASSRTLRSVDNR